MTRINSAIPCKNLTDEHLLAEHREIKRLPSCLKRWRDVQKKIPDKFTLGRGHVLFFLNKMKFTYNRYCEIHTECTARGFDVTDYSENWREFVDSEYWNDYTPTDEERQLLTERISKRINESTKEVWRLGRRSISKQDAIDLLK